MIRLAARGILTRPAQTGIVMLCLVITLVGLAGLSAGARSATATLDGDLGRAWDTPFDLLVRPAGATESLERTQGLVRPNYASGIDGGITMGQLAQIRNVPGVVVAAPLATIGAVNWPSAYQVHLPHTRPAVYRITSTVRGQAGLSRYPVETRYVVVAPGGRLEFTSSLMTTPGHKAPIVCAYPVNCFAGTVCFDGDCAAGQYPSASDANYYLPLLQPVQVAGIDPSAEARLTGIRACIRKGRLLSAADKPSPTQEPEPAEVLPVIASQQAFLDQVLHVHIAAGTLGRTNGPTEIHRWRKVARHAVGLQTLYRRYLATSVRDYVDPWPIWTAGDVRYRQVGPDHLAARTTPRNPQIYTRVNSFQEVGIDDSVLIPPESRDPWLRSVTEHSDLAAPGPGSNYRSKIWDVVGEYDPRCLRGFSRLAGASLEGYAAPDVRAPGGEEITPTRALSDYVASPPLLLTTLAGAHWLANPARYRGQPGDAFISVIRVQVKHTGDPGEAAQSHLAAAAAAIHERTGLQVDIVKGASTRPIRVDIPAGTFGRPAMTVREQWSVKGVAITFYRAVRTQDRILIGLLFLAAGLLVGQGSFISAKQRLLEFGRLRALGWSALRVAALIELETMILGLTAGLISTVVALPIVLSLDVAPVVPLSAPLFGITISAVAALPTAWWASRGSAISAMDRVQPIRRSRPTATTAALAARDLIRTWPVETSIGVAAVAIGATLVGLVVLVAEAFRTQLDTTVLGTALSTQVRPFDVVLAALTLVLGTAAAVEVVVVAWLSRRQQLGVLKALGWSGPKLARLVCAQAVLMGAASAAVAVSLVAVCAQLLTTSARSTELALGTTLFACLGATAIAALIPAALALWTPARRLLLS